MHHLTLLGNIVTDNIVRLFKGSAIELAIDILLRIYVYAILTIDVSVHSCVASLQLREEQNKIEAFVWL